jgi:16S rRNA (guanine966-N2)-methyltransferase
MRVIAGSLGGRSLVAPKGLATRPTTDRVREALFSVLGDVSGASVLDLYAGTGALGIEALSRGATRAVFVENARPALDALRRNLETLGLRSVSTIVTNPVLRAVRGLTSTDRFDLVFVDPPYADLKDAVQALEVVVGAKRCAEDVRVVLEHASRDDGPEVKGLVFLATRRYGDTSLSLYSGQTLRGDEGEREKNELPGQTREDVSSQDADG